MREHVGQLRMVWSRAMQPGPQEVEPIVYNGIMFLVNSEDIVQALDATNGDLLWEYKRKLPANIGKADRDAVTDIATCRSTTTRSSWPPRTPSSIALEAKTGKVVWETQRANYRDQVAQTTGPIVVKGKLINGSRCNPQSPLPGGCFITAHDARHGEELWRSLHGGQARRARRRHVGRVAARSAAAMRRPGWPGATIRS